MREFNVCSCASYVVNDVFIGHNCVFYVELRYVTCYVEDMFESKFDVENNKVVS